MEKDDFLRELIQKSPLESPSDDFVDRIMANIQLTPEAAPEKKPYFLYVKAVFPYALLSLILGLVFSTSDLPFLHWVPGKDYLFETFIHSFGSLFAGLRNAFSSKFVSFALLISASAGLLFLIDRWFSQRSTI